MTHNPHFISPETTVSDALLIMQRHNFRHLPVIADGQLVGLVSIGDVVKQRVEEIESESEAMRDYIRTA